MRPFRWKALATGAAIATLVFFPLLNALAVDHGYWLHWRTQDTLETLGAWALLGGLASVTIWLPAAFKSPRWAEAVNAIWLLIGGFFAMGALVKTSAIRDVAMQYRAASPWIAAVLLTLFCVLSAVALRRWQRTGGRPIERLTLGLSPLVAVFAFQLGAAQWYHREPPAGHGVAGSTAPRTAVAPLPSRHVRTLVLLFDELSRDYLYGADAASLSQLPALRQFVAESTVYAGAFLPGGETKLAIPALFAPSRPQDWQSRGGLGPTHLDDVAASRRGWLEEAEMRGLDVRVFGWHLDYCTGIAVAATECRAVSIYNRRTLKPNFSLLHPFWTTMSLLPADIPFGWVKTGPAIAMHRGTYDLACSWMQQQLTDPRADVVYVHVDVPHVPFLDDSLTGRERFIVTPERYVRQLRFADAFLATAMEVISGEAAPMRPTRVVVMSDHNVRRLTPQATHERVVFTVREPGGRNPGRDEQRAPASELLSKAVLTLE